MSTTTIPICYNSTITVSPTGAILASYDKTHLYYTDETWAQESASGWLTYSLPLPWRGRTPAPPNEETGIKASFGICMDINPHRFTAPWTSYEYATASLLASADILLLSMAWLTQPPLSSTAENAPPEPAEPDSQTWAYWCARLQPLIEQRDRDIVVVVACRCGEEGENKYAGTSWVGRVGRGKVAVWGVLGNGDEKVLVVDTEAEAWDAGSGGY